MKIQDMIIDINTMCDFEQLTGKSLMKVLDNTEDLFMTDVRALVQAGLGTKNAKEAGQVLMDYLKDESQVPILELLSEKLSESGIVKTKKKE